MYQEIRFLNQDACFLNQDVCFLNQEERRQFLISFVSERDWRREHRLEFKMASNRFYILLYSKCKWIFRRFALLVAAVRDCVNENTDGGHAELWAKIRLNFDWLWYLYKLKQHGEWRQQELKKKNRFRPRPPRTRMCWKRRFFLFIICMCNNSQFPDCFK